jgi:uncharacterized protein
MSGRVRAQFLSATPALLAVLVLAPTVFGQINVDKLPKPTGYVSDLAHILQPAQESELEAYCTKVEQQLGVQFAFVTVDSLGGEPIRDVALNIARKWGVGSSKDNSGVLLLLAIKDHQNDIETGRGIEPYITDGFAGSTLRSMRPELRAGDYGAALMTAARAMAAQIAQGKGLPFSDAQLPPRASPGGSERSHGIAPILLLLGFFFLLWLLSRSGGRRGGGGGGSGFLTGLILGNLMRGGRGSGGSWGGGGFGGGGSGGGGFGGFGGGDFGGGGASSNW